MRVSGILINFLRKNPPDYLAAIDCMDLSAIHRAGLNQYGKPIDDGVSPTARGAIDVIFGEDEVPVTDRADDEIEGGLGKLHKGSLSGEHGVTHTRSTL